MRKITLFVNGQEHSLEVEEHKTLLRVLRDQLRLTGTKEGCGTGECGACTVLLNRKAVNACLVLAVEAEGQQITTIEGLGMPGNLHPLQASFVEHGAVQCGFCTPGMVLAAQALLDENPHPSEEEIRLALAGNLCRCTGYAKIVKAIQAVAKGV
jgi:aerobic carbon-monoxide dehydrogenase small subunit